MGKKKRAVVTGGAGFIGSHLVERLLSEGMDVLVVDNCSTGRLENLAHLKQEPGLDFEHLDVNNVERLNKLFGQIDAVFHLAALADIVPSMERPLDYHQANVSGTIHCLEAARINRVGKFLYAASSSCYGIPDVYPTPETAEIRPMYPYALTKYLGEQYVLHWNKTYSLPCVSLRFFNVYGPRSRTSGTYGAVFGVFLAQKLNNKPFTVVGDGAQTRDFTYVSDVADALFSAYCSSLNSAVMNVGSGNTYSVNELCDRLGGDKTYIPKRPGEPDCTFADISRIKSLLGWCPKVSFEEGINRMLANIDYWRQAPLWTADSIADATKDWHRYLGDSNNAS